MDPTLSKKRAAELGQLTNEFNKRVACLPRLQQPAQMSSKAAGQWNPHVIAKVHPSPPRLLKSWSSPVVVALIKR